MTKAEQRKAFMEIRDMCKTPKFEEIGGRLYSKNDESSKLHEVLDKTGNLDVDYADHLEGKNGYDMAAKAGRLTFKECCTVLTFLLRAERFTEGAFTEALQDGTVYKLLSRAVEVM